MFGKKINKINYTKFIVMTDQKNAIYDPKNRKPTILE